MAEIVGDGWTRLLTAAVRRHDRGDDEELWGAESVIDGGGGERRAHLLNDRRRRPIERTRSRAPPVCNAADAFARFMMSRGQQGTVPKGPSS
jgi:hypothetical protein